MSGRLVGEYVMFVDREAELGELNRLHVVGGAQLFILYGRRRVGKTELLREFVKDKACLFFVATLASDGEQLAGFSQEIWGCLHGDVPQGFSFPSWEAAFRALAELPAGTVVVLDEFTYLISANRALPSILQKVWDEQLRAHGTFLVLCGSYIGMMEEHVLGYQAPLYGRRTGGLLLRPLDLKASAEFFPEWTAERALEAWAVLGGLPYYLSIFKDTTDLPQAVRSLILDVRGVLHHEPRLLVMEELREPRNYFSVLSAVAQGRTRLNEIAQGAGVGQATTVSRYLDVLQKMRLITREVPATESRPDKSKKGIYRIDDHFLRFWFRYVHPYEGSLELGLSDAVLEQRVRPTFSSFVASAFEEASRAHVVALARTGVLPFLPERVGSWWDRTREIDVVAVSEQQCRALVGECKWSTKPVGTDVLDDLRDKAEVMRQATRPYDVTSVLFSRSGFTPALVERAEREGVILVGVAELFGG
jgi:AAA+ ATPase superfamily predicted ATPase